MKQSNKVLGSFLDRLKRKWSADTALILAFALIAVSSFQNTYYGTRIETNRISITSEPIYLTESSSMDLKEVLHINIEDGKDHDIQYVVRNEDGSPSSTIHVVKGEVSATESGTGYLYAYVDGVQSGNAVPVYVYADETEKENAILAHETMAQNEISEDGSPKETGVFEEKPDALTVSSDAVQTEQEVQASEQGRVVIFHHEPMSGGLVTNYIEDYYIISPSARAGEGSETSLFSIISQRVSEETTNLRKPSTEVFPELAALYAVINQREEFLPRIWHISSEGKRTLLNPAEILWSSSDEAVIAVADGIPVITGIGSAVLTGLVESGSISIAVEVIEGSAVDSFKEQADAYVLGFAEEEKYYQSEAVYYWPTEIPDDAEDPVTVKGGRIYLSGNQYYYLEDDFEGNWEELVSNAVDYQDHLIQLSRGLVLMEGDNLDGIVRGTVFRHHDQFWVYTGDAGEEIAAPYEDDNSWIEITELFGEYDPDYDPGADTGPESDALFYFESQYNPYPGSVSSNCTYAVWALANEALGVRLPNWGDAGNWYRRAGISGYKTGQNPAVYSIVVWDHHVGFVTDVNEDGTMMYIKEGNFSGKYHEGWWAVSSSRHGQSLYGFIYLTDDTGKAVNAKTVEVAEGFTGTEEEFLALLEELGLEPGVRTEEYSSEIEAGNIIIYTTGDLAVGSVVNYTVSLGENPAIVIDEDTLDELIGMDKDELLAWFDKHGLLPGTETQEESNEEEEGTVLGVEKGTYEAGDKVNYTTAKKAEEPAATPTPTPEATPTSTPEATPEATPESTPEATPESTPEATPESTPEATPESTPEATPEATPESTPEATPESTPEATPESTPEVVTPEPSVTPQEEEPVVEEEVLDEVQDTVPEENAQVEPEPVVEAVPETEEETVPETSQEEVSEPAETPEAVEG